MRINYQFLSLISIASLICFNAITQEVINTKELFIEAESYFLFEEYRDALPLYQKIIRTEPNNYNVLFKIGVCYLNDTYLANKSLQYLKQSAENINLKYKRNNFREKQAPLEALYYFGRAYHINNMLDEAIESYQRFKNLAHPDEFDIDIVNEDINACQVAKKMLGNPVFFSPINMGNTINSRFEEINPVVSGDGKTLIFTRKLQFYDGVFLSKKDDNGNWYELINLTSDFGLDGNTYSCGISYFGDEIFVYRSDNYDGNIYSSKLVGDNWGRLIKLNFNINTKFWESHATPSPDGQYLYFTSNRTGGYGGLDIYKSKKGAKGEWGSAVNLGPVINSPYNEDTPFLSNEGYTIFFSSQGHETMGGYDIFVSNLKSNGTWSKPKNMGSPVNTTNDDLFYNPIGVNSFGYYSLFDESSSFGMLDIYKIEVYNEMIPRSFEVKGQLNVADASSRFYKKLTAKLIDTETREIVNETMVEGDGSISLPASQGAYILVIEGQEVESYQKEIILSLTQPETIVVLPAMNLVKTDSKTPPVEIGSPVKEKIVAKSDFYAVSDSSVVPISLIIPKGSDLNIEVSVNDRFGYSERLESVNKRFTYFYKPKPGENLLKFTATDKDGVISSTEVVVTYYLPYVAEKEIKLQEKEAILSLYAKSFDLLAVGALQEYLHEIETSDFKSYYHLYTHLLEVSEEKGFIKKDIDEVFSIYFTQKSIILFDLELKKAYSEQDSNWQRVLDSSTIPIIYIQTLLKKKLVLEKNIQEALLKIVSDKFESGKETYNYLLGFHRNTDEFSIKDIDMATSVQAWELLSNNIGDKDAYSLLQLASTTEGLDYFYQNLLAASTDSLHDYLTSIQFEPLGINNSVDLTEHLFDIASQGSFTLAELIKILELVSNNKKYYLNSFNEVLTNSARGTLKSQLLLLNMDEKQIHSYEGLLRYLVEQSQHKDFSREEVYNLLLELIGITDINVFAHKIKSYSIASINKALADTSLKYFSNPFELLQYLLVSVQDYDFTESDINNLLIRMILERGLAEGIDKNYDVDEKKIWKNKNFLTSIILVNIVILILIILLSRRRKK